MAFILKHKKFLEACEGFFSLLDKDRQGELTLESCTESLLELFPEASREQVWFRLLD